MSHLRLVRPTHPAAAPLLAGLRHEYQRAYGPEVAAELDLSSPREFLPPGGAFLIVEEHGVTVAGGGLCRLGDGLGEIKRMWTAPARRGAATGGACWPRSSRQPAAAATTRCGSRPAASSSRRSPSTHRSATPRSSRTGATSASTLAASASRSA